MAINLLNDECETEFEKTKESLKECGFCKTSSSRYTCPRCFIPYCSMNCYQSNTHLTCSEEFYKKCVYEDMKDSKTKLNGNSKIEMERILRKLAEEDQGAIDSDDSCDSDENIEERFANIDLESPDTVWNLLTEKEKENFESLIESNKILNYLPEFAPWWTLHKFELIQEVGAADTNGIPNIREDIPPLSKLTSKKPSESVLYGLMNALYGYCSITRLFLHDWSDVKATVDTLLKISSNLSSGQQFSSAHSAVEHARMSALASDLLPDLCATLNKDVAQIMKDSRLVLASLSDLHQFLDSRAAAELPKKKNKLFMVVKKIEFYLSYVHEYGIELPILL